MTQGPWSVKGIDPKARSVARERAQRRGVTLGQYLNSLLLDDDEPAGDIQDIDIGVGGFVTRDSAPDDLRRMSAEIDELSQRLETSQARTARSMAGIDKSIIGLMGKIDTTNKAQLSGLERVSRAMGDIEQAQHALRSRIDTLETTNRGGATTDALRTLEQSLGHLSSVVQERLGAVEGEQQSFRDLFEEKVGAAIRSTGLPGRIDGIEESMSAAERRMEGALGRITDAASRFELFETKAERAVGDTTWRMERALESNLTRSRAMSKELLDRVDGIEEKTREAVSSLADAVTRITDRLQRAERKGETITHVLERSVSEIDERVARIGSGGGNLEEVHRIQSQFQKRLDALAEDLSRPIHAVRVDVERKLEEALRSGSGQPEKLERLERTLRQVQDQLQQSETRQANAVEAMSAQLDRLGRTVDERLRAVEARDDGRTVEDVRREMLRLADSIEARLASTETHARSTSGSLDHLRADTARLSDSIDGRFEAAEKNTAAALDEVGNQVSLVAERLQRRHDESMMRLTHRIEETAAAQAAGLGPLDFDKLADRLDERVRDSERRSAEAIGQIGEQVARVADRLQTQHQESLRTLEKRLSESDRAHEARLTDVLSDMSRRMDEIGEQSASQLAPVHKTVSSIAKRVEEIEDVALAGASRQQPAPQPPGNLAPGNLAAPSLASLEDTFVVIEDAVPEPAADMLEPAPAPVFAAPEIPDTADVVGVEPPPFDRRDAALFEEVPPPPVAAAPAAPAPAATRIDDLLEMDDFVLAEPQPVTDFVADLPADDPRERPGSDYLAEARRAAQQGRRVSADPVGAKKGLGKGPLLAASALAVAVAGGGAWTIMRGKQESHKNDDFAKLDPSSPQASAGDPKAAAAVLFDDAHKDGDAPVTAAAPAPDLKTDPRNPAAADLFDEPTATAAKTDAKSAKDAKADAKAGKPDPKAAKAAPLVTLTDAVNDGDPVALHDYALELLQTGEKARGVSMMKEAAGKGLVMAQYRMAKLYEKGEGVPRDMAASRSWTEKAAIGGNVKAMHDLAVFYAEGDAGPQSYAAAVEWFRQASDLGLVDSQYNLAVLYEQGLGVSQDKTEAAYWFEIAGRAGDKDAVRRAGVLEGDMSPAQIDQLKRKARSFSPKQAIARANGDFGRRAWEAASQTQIAEVQRLLAKLGYAPGGTDGSVTAKTTAAIKQFETDNDLPVTGDPSDRLLRSLRTAAVKAGG